MRYSARWPSSPREPPRSPPTPRQAPADPVPLLSNAELAAIFHEIGSLLEIKGELVFKTVAYHRAADAIAHSPHEIARAYREGHPPAIPGVGSAISDKIAELATTGHLRFLDRLHGEVPPTLVELLEMPGVGPKTVRLLWERLGIETLDDLRTGLRAGTIRGVPGLSEKGLVALAAGVEAVDRRSTRMTLGTAERIIEGVAALLVDVPGVLRVEPAGSFRRRRETIGDLDLLVETDDAQAVIERFTTLPAVESVVNAGPHKAAVRLAGGPQVDLMIDAARGVRDLPRALHGQQGAQRPAAGDRPRPGLEPVREGLRAAGRRWRDRDGSGRGAADVRQRGRGLRVPGAGRDPAGAARGHRGGRGGPRRRPAAAGGAGRPARRLPRPL